MGEAEGDRWQREAAAHVARVRHDLVVETGVDSGVSTTLLLRTLDATGGGGLISIDPFTSFKLDHPRWTHVKQLSVPALPALYIAHGPFDVFIHDSDHDAECQYFEYEFAWEVVRPGGYIMSDDVTWGGHGAWEAFLRRHAATAAKIGHAGVTQKPVDAPLLLADVYQRAEQILADAQAFARSHGDRTPRYTL